MQNFQPISLGKFNPSAFHEVTIAAELQEWLAAVGIVSADVMLSKGRLPIEIRKPEDHIRIATTDRIVTQWHRDGLGKNALSLSEMHVPSIRWMILWSNGTPTNLCSRTGTEYRFEPYDVILIDNHTTFHRCPAPEDNRWFVRFSRPILPATIGV